MTEHQASTAAGEWERSHSPVVVAVDGSEHNRSAVVWAATEAARGGADLRLVCVAEEGLLPHLGRGTSRERAQHAVDAALDLARPLVGEQHLSGEVLTGGVVGALLDNLGRARLLAVGKRGQHAFPRALVGSTSLSLAGRSPAPVAVVPDAWDPAAHASGPVVLGVDHDHETSRLLHLAFRRAERLDAPLVAVHGDETFTPDDGSDPDHRAGTGEQDDRLVTLLRPWRDRFPTVDVTVVDTRQHPAIALLDAGEDAQLVVLGRRPDSRFAGFGFGSVTRAVLHYAECPVLVAPLDD